MTMAPCARQAPGFASGLARRWRRPGQACPHRAEPLAHRRLERLARQRVAGHQAPARKASIGQHPGEAEGRSGIRLACNVSPVQLRVPGFPQLVEEALARHAVPPELLLVEVTEAVLTYVAIDGAGRPRPVPRD